MSSGINLSTAINFFENKSPPIASPHHYLRYIRCEKRLKHLPFPVPSKIIIVFQKALVNLLQEKYQIQQYPFLMNSNIYYSANNPTWALVSNPGIGAPSLALLMELLVALGSRIFICCGAAGAIKKNLKAGDIVVCEKSLREEGTSFHYLASNNKYVSACKIMTKKIKMSCQNLQINFYAGANWSTDACYRETTNKIKKYQTEGIFTVDMEASAFFAIGKYYKLEVGTIFTISDSLAGEKWEPYFKKKEVLLGLEKTFLIATSVLSNCNH